MAVKFEQHDDSATPKQTQLSPEETSIRLAAILNSSDDAIVGKDLNGIVNSWNRAAERMFGYAPEEIIGRSILTIIPPELQHEEVEILRKLNAGERIDHFETERVTKDGRRVPVSLTISPLLDSHGRIIGAAKIARDISDKTQFHRDRLRLAAIVESSDDAIVSKDLNGIIMTWNAAAERLFGYNADEIVGRSVLTIIPPELQSEEPEILRKLRSGQRIDHYETQRLRKDGERIWVSLTISPIKDPSGKVIGASKIARDISERKRVQEALIQSEKLAATGRMAAAIAHEINNPLEAVTNLAYLLCNDRSLNPTAHSYAQMLLDEVGRASEITKQTLSFYRDSGKPSWFKVSDLLDSVISINRMKLDRQSIKLTRDYGTSEKVFGFASEVRQVFANLVLNAIEAMPQGGEILVRARYHANGVDSLPTVRISVADNGVGISPEHREQLFQPFFTTKPTHGNGLGLWVSRGIMEKHGGSIKVKSCTQRGHSGTVFSVSIPVGTTPLRKQSVA